MNAHKTDATTTKSSSKKPASPIKRVAPASPFKVPGQLPSFPSNTTVDTMCSEEEEDEVQSEAETEEQEQEQQQQEQDQQQLHFVGAEDGEEGQHAKDAAATRAFAILEELSQPKQPMAAPLKTVRSASYRWHRSLLHTEEHVEALLPVRLLL